MRGRPLVEVLAEGWDDPQDDGFDYWDFLVDTDSLLLRDTARAMADRITELETDNERLRETVARTGSYFNPPTTLVAGADNE